MKKNEQQVSVTAQMDKSIRDGAAALATEMGMVRRNRKTGKEIPNVTWAISSLLEYALAHMTDYRAWLANGRKDPTS